MILVGGSADREQESRRGQTASSSALGAPDGASRWRVSAGEYKGDT